MKKFDIIFAGGGLSALLTLSEMLQRPAFRDKKILLLDRSDKRSNDRTWCFWAPDDTALPPVMFRTWNYCHFYGPGYAEKMNIHPYRYRMVRGIDFYEWAGKQISAAAHVQRLQCNILEIDADSGIVSTDAGIFQGEWVLNSALTNRTAIPEALPFGWKSPFTAQQQAISKPYIHLLQHFRGWVIRSAEAQFDTEAVTMMDFRIDQKGETRFVYVLPLSAQEALVEFTVFSPALLSENEYDSALRAYISEYLKLQHFEVVETEFGIIPMSNYPFQPKTTARVVHIGTAGAYVKASSGYAFKRSVRLSKKLVDHWEKTGSPAGFDARSSRACRLFDTIFLRVLQDRNELGAQIFANLFGKLPASLVLRFLDEDASAFEMFRIMLAAPRLPFMKAAILTMSDER